MIKDYYFPIYLLSSETFYVRPIIDDYETLRYDGYIMNDRKFNLSGEKIYSYYGNIKELFIN